MNDNLRQLFPITGEFTYLNHAAVSPPPQTAIDALNAQLRDVQLHGSLNFRGWLQTKERARRLLAELLGARDPNRVALMRNTSDALATVANGMRWQTNDNIVTFASEFPSNVYPWRRIRDKHGVELRFCPEQDGRIDLDQFTDLINENTKLVTISAVQYASGFRADLRFIAEAARKVDALFVVDTIQALGVVPVDVENELIDVAAGACHKWLLAPEGIGYLYLSERAGERIEPTLTGWVSVENPEDYNNFEQPLRGGAMAWETGVMANSLFYALEASLGLLAEYGTAKIHAHLIELTDFLCGELQNRDYEIVSSRVEGEKSPIVCIKHRRGVAATELYKRLQNNKIIVAPRGDRLRIAPHLYNTRADIERLLAVLP